MIKNFSYMRNVASFELAPLTKLSGLIGGLGGNLLGTTAGGVAGATYNYEC